MVFTPKVGLQEVLLRTELMELDRPKRDALRDGERERWLPRLGGERDRARDLLRLLRPSMTGAGLCARVLPLG